MTTQPTINQILEQLSVKAKSVSKTRLNKYYSLVKAIGKLKYNPLKTERNLLNRKELRAKAAKEEKDVMDYILMICL